MVGRVRSGLGCGFDSCHGRSDFPFVAIRKFVNDSEDVRHSACFKF